MLRLVEVQSARLAAMLLVLLLLNWLGSASVAAQSVSLVSFRTDFPPTRLVDSKLLPVLMVLASLLL